jgi:NAD(P) transhydrogenase
MTGVAHRRSQHGQVTSPDGSVKVRGRSFSSPAPLARPKNVQFNDENGLDATTVLEMKQLPKSMVVIGGGVIGSEYACLFNALGVTTTGPSQTAGTGSLLDGEIGESS